MGIGDLIFRLSVGSISRKLLSSLFNGDRKFDFHSFFPAETVLLMNGSASPSTSRCRIIIETKDACFVL
jgi:hypothetical protein